MKTFKILLVSFLALTLMSVSCSADEEETVVTESTFTVPEYFRGTWQVEQPVERAGEIVTISEHELNINGLIINQGIDGATTQTSYTIHGEFTDLNGVRTVYGTHDVGLSMFTTDGLWVIYDEINDGEHFAIYVTR